MHGGGRLDTATRPVHELRLGPTGRRLLGKERVQQDGPAGARPAHLFDDQVTALIGRPSEAGTSTPLTACAGSRGHSKSQREEVACRTLAVARLILAQGGDRGMEEARDEAVAHLFDQFALAILELRQSAHQAVHLGRAARLRTLGEGLDRRNRATGADPPRERDVGLIDQLLDPTPDAVTNVHFGPSREVVDRDEPGAKNLAKLRGQRRWRRKVDYWRAMSREQLS